MMGEGRSADALPLVQAAAWRRSIVFADLLEDMKAPRLGKRACNTCEFALGQDRDGRVGNRQISSIRKGFRRTLRGDEATKMPLHASRHGG
jgi:hypothetical protein